MVVMVLAGCDAEQRDADLERQVAELQRTVADLDGRLDAVDHRVGALGEKVEPLLDRAPARLAVPPPTGRWYVHTDPLSSRGCGDAQNPSDYTWDVVAAGPDAFSIRVGGTTGFPTIDVALKKGVLSGASSNSDGATATVMAEATGDGLTGFRVFSRDGCEMTWKLTASRTPAR